MSEKKNKGYKDTLNLPKTNFSMKANLTQKEPQLRKSWLKEKLYQKVREHRKGAPKYILHDGPPYANGDIHMGHVINKVLKDFVVRYKTMAGFDAPYTPGWDCHGLPIEVKVMAELGGRAKDMSKTDIRKKCKKYASKYVKKQSKQFQELGTVGDYDNPYLTLKPQYEKGILEIFAELVEKGLVYKQLKPIHWSVGCQTALADAELEYKDIESPSIYVNFPVENESIEKLKQAGLQPEGCDGSEQYNFMIWTTTPWTLAANLAVAVNPKLEYVALRYENDGENIVSIVAYERLKAVLEAVGLSEGQYTLSSPVRGDKLETLRYKHPFVEDNPTEQDAYFVITADFVSTEDGTGLVHIAPGHGVDDYIAGQQHNLAIYSPVDEYGQYDDTVPEWLKGKKVLEVDGEVNKKLDELDLLIKEDKILHSYPHCWRSKLPVIFRATEQWFISVDKEVPGEGDSLRNLALKKNKNVRWIPHWGQKRMQGMLESRPDWCISRQRIWGLPIPSFVNSEGKALLTRDSVLAIAEHIGENGSDSWFTDSPKEILGEDFELPEGFSWDDLHKEDDIFDVWFESGCSWYSVIRKAGYQTPVDLYLEGSDQHRGWFQLSLLPALGVTGQPPYKNVLTHGFTVDEHGMKQSKSLGNYVNAQEEIKKYGSDIIRLWVASVNYQEDMRCSDELIGKTQDAYRKIRNTLRFLFGNIKDFDPAKDSVKYEDMEEIDRWATQQLQKLITEARDNYDNFIFHKAFSAIYNFCTVQMSNIYMDLVKDILYCEKAESPKRRSCQTAMYNILDILIKLLAPVLVHTSQEAWSKMEHKSQDVEYVLLADMPEPDKSIDFTAEQEKWDNIMKVRNEAMRVLEQLRQEKTISSNQQGSVTIKTNDKKLLELLNNYGEKQLAELFIVSEVKIEEGDKELEVTAEKSSYEKCQRCWNFYESVGKNNDYPELCSRCVEVVKNLE
jgi:isoleucyl-tRNA synthetase